MAQTGCKCYCSNPPGSFFNCNPAPGSNCQTCCNNAVSNGGYWACNDVIGKDDKDDNSISASNNRLPKMRRERYSNFIGFGTGLKVIWFGVVGLVLLAVVSKGVKVYKETKN